MTCGRCSSAVRPFRGIKPQKSIVPGIFNRMNMRVGSLWDMRYNNNFLYIRKISRLVHGWQESIKRFSFEKKGLNTLEALDGMMQRKVCMLYLIRSSECMMMSSNGNIFRVTGFLWGKPPVTGGFPSQRFSNAGFDVFIDVDWNKRWSEQSSGNYLRRHGGNCDVTVAGLVWLNICSLTKAYIWLVKQV